MTRSTSFDADLICTTCNRFIVFDMTEAAFFDDPTTHFCGFVDSTSCLRQHHDDVVVTVPGQRHSNFHLWEVIDGMLQLHDTPADERMCDWCDKPAVILLPASRNDNAWPQLTQRACFDHSGLDHLVNAQDGTAPYVTEYLNYFEISESK